MTRPLKNYTKKERLDIEAISTMFPLSHLIDATFASAHPDLYTKIVKARPDEENQILSDIADYVNGSAKFPEQLYHVKLLEGDNGYLNYHERLDIYSVDTDDDSDEDYKTKFTMPEIKKINEKYVPFAISVADEEIEKINENHVSSAITNKEIENEKENKD